MSKINCPYCEIREIAKIKSHFEAFQTMQGDCPDCGAHLDIGQKALNVNGYADIYKGVLSVIEDVVQQINNLMDYLGVDTLVDDEIPCVRLNAREIVSDVFTPYAGGTSVSNFMKAIGIDDDEVTFEVKAEQHEW